MTRYVKSGTVNTVQEINSELEKIAEAQEDFLARDGETPNSMKGTLDMDSNRITNLPAPASPSDPVRSIDLPNFITEDNNLLLITREERKVLSAGQVSVTFSDLTTTQTAYYISGSSVDQGRLIPNVDYIVTSTTSITLTDSYPEGTSLTAVQNEGVEEVTADIQVFDNVAEMKAASLSVGDTVLCKRYYANGELVDGLLFNIVTAGTGTDDGGSYHDLALNQAHLIANSSRVNVTQFGAKGDGVTDDFASITAAIGYIGNSASNGTVVFPEGVFMVSDTVDMNTITRPPNLIGSGSSSTTIRATSAFATSQAIIEILRTEATRLNDRVFQGFTLRDSNAKAKGIKMQWVAQCTFRDIGLYALTVGLESLDTLYSCVFEQVKTSLSEGIGLILRDESNQLLFNNCIFSGSTVGIQMLGSAYAVKFNNCDVEAGTSYHVQIQPATGKVIKGLSFDNCYFENGADYSIYIRPDDADGLRGFSIDSCYFQVQPSNFLAPLFLRNCTHGTISNNSANRYSDYFYNRAGTAKYLEICNNSYDTTSLNNAGDTESSGAFSKIFNNATGATQTTGLGTPEGVVTASVGSVFFRTDGGTGTVFYVKETGTGNTGWVAK